MSGRHFQPGLWGTLATLVLLAIFILLGLWQLDRGDQKHDLRESYLQQQQLPPLSAANLTDMLARDTNLNGRQVRLQGHYLNKPQLLLDNQLHQGKVGYYVYSAFQADDFALIIWVNRGWTPIQNSRQQAPNLNPLTTEAVRIQGTLSKPANPALQLADTTPEKLPPDWLRLQAMNITAISGYLGLSALPLALRLTGDTEPNLNRNWAVPGSGEQKHYGYALQWFAFAVLLLAIYSITAFRPLPAED